MWDEGEDAGLFGPVSAFLLGLIKRLIRCLDQIGGRGVSAGDHAGEARADGPATTIGMCNSESLDSLPKRFRYLGCPIHSGAGKHDDEFVSAVPSNEISRSIDGSGNRSGDLSEAFVARRMAESIVIGFESIDVEHNQRERRQFTDGTPPFLVKKVIELPSVGNACETIKTGQAKQHLIRFLELTHHFKKLLLSSAPPVYFVDQTQHRSDTS